MDLPMNRELAMLSKRVLLRQDSSSFRQDARLVLAIENLSKSQCPSNLEDGNAISLSLPERKLNFEEVRQMLSQSTPRNNGNGGGNKYVASSEVSFQNVIDIRKPIVKKIEAILEGIKKVSDSGETPKLILRNQRLWSNCIYDLDRVTLKAFNESKKTTICYSDSEDKRRFNTIVFVLSKVHELLSKNLTVTRRELFYQNVSRLRKQSNLDVAVRDVCCLLESPPWELGIVATAKGLIAGPLTMVAKDGSVVDCMTSGGTLIPQDVVGIKEFKSTAKYILVVEKDAIFQKLLDEGALVRLGPVIIITGKGYPDVCTRLLVRRLSGELRLRALALVDADPHGIEIFLTYKYGSLAQSHISSSLACGGLALAGARRRDVTSLAPEEALLRLTDLDKRKLHSLLKRPYLDNASGAEIKEELRLMLSSGVKAELEALAPNTALCDAYLPAKIIDGQFLG